MGYWIGVPYWNKGYCSEAAKALIGYGFDELGLNRVFAEHMVRNPASGRVMEKAGMTYEGTLRQHVKKWDRYEDLKVYGILRTELLRRLNVKLKVVLEPSDEGGYTVLVPSLPGCISEGETLDEALVNIREAIELYLEPVDRFLELL